MPTLLNDLPGQRIASIDAFRGLTFLVMLFVNFLAGATQIPPGIHPVAADVDGMHLADIVFPAFLFAVGMSIPFGLQARIRRGDSAAARQLHVAYRAVALVTMGFFMVNAESGYHQARMAIPIDAWALLFYLALLMVWGDYHFASKTLTTLARAGGIAIMLALALAYRSSVPGAVSMTPQWWGILGLIGWAYLIATLMVQLVRGRVAWLLVVLFACAGVSIASTISGAVVGLAVHLVHALIVLCGTLCALLFFDGAPARMRGALVFALVLALAAWLLHQFYPISKIGATLPWALYCAALCTLLFAALYWLIELRGQRAWTALVEPAASNPLITYLLPFVLGAAMNLAGLYWPPAVTEGNGALAFALLFSGAVILAVSILNRYRFKLKI